MLFVKYRGAFSVFLFVLSGCTLVEDHSQHRRAIIVTEISGHPQHSQRSARIVEEDTNQEGLPAPTLLLTPEVKHELYEYLGENRKFVTEALDGLRRYDRVIRRAFSRNGVPEELIAVGLVESGFQPAARNPSGARGIWQFMKDTARSYGLVVGLYDDERYSPKASSDAAARHLKDLFDQYKDWYLALAAYNAGSGAVNRALKEEQSRDFWTLAREGVFSKETRQFVPRVIAAAVILDDPGRFGFGE